MGKGNRAKNQRAQNVLATGVSKKATKKKGMPTWVGTAIVAGVLALLILFTVFVVLDSRGVLVRGKVIASTENFEITVPMMSYLIYSDYQQFCSDYGSYLSIYKGTGGEALNTSKDLRDQNYSVVVDQTTGLTQTTTWFDYFATGAGASAEQILILCECAKAANITLSEADHQQIQQALNMYEIYAMLEQNTLDYYLAEKFGKGVRLDDIRAMMELSQLATKYNELRREELENGANETRVDEYYEAHKKDYDVTVNYMGFEFVTVFTPAASDDADAATKNAENLAIYEAEKQKFKERVEALKACENENAFNAKLLQYFEEDATAAGEENPQAVAIQKLTEATKINYSKPNSPTAVDSWLFSETARVEGDTTNFIEEKEAHDAEKNEYTKATSTYSAYIVTKSLHRNDTKVRDVGHILFKNGTYKNLTNTSTLSGQVKDLAESLLASGQSISDENMAKALLKKMKDEGAITEKTEGGITYYVIDKEKFEEFGKTFNEDSNIFYEDVEMGKMVAEFEDWLFDSVRVEGEISYPSAVKTTYGYHIMYYGGEGEETWFIAARNNLVNADYESWYNEMKQTYKITTKDKNWNAIDG